MAGCLCLLALARLHIYNAVGFLLPLLKIYDLLFIKNWNNVVLLSSLSS